MRWNKLGRTRVSYRYTHTVWAVQLIVSNVRSRFSSLSACFCFADVFPAGALVVFPRMTCAYLHVRSQADGISGRRAVMVIVCKWVDGDGQSVHVYACGMTAISFCKEIVGARLRRRRAFFFSGIHYNTLSRKCLLAHLKKWIRSPRYFCCGRWPSPVVCSPPRDHSKNVIVLPCVHVKKYQSHGFICEKASVMNLIIHFKLVLALFFWLEWKKHSMLFNLWGKYFCFGSFAEFFFVN